jgi:integrase
LREISSPENTDFRDFAGEVVAVLDLVGFSAWLRENELSEGTQQLYMRFLQNYSEYTGGKTPDKQTIKLWKEHLLEANQPQTVNLKLSAISKYCAFAGLPVRVKRVKVQRCTMIRNAITRSEVERLIDGLEADGCERFAVIVRLLSKTGGRISEVIRITKQDISRGYVDMQTKGKVRRIYLPDTLADELAPFLADLSPGDVLCRNRFGRQITANGVGKMLRKFAERYGIQPEHVHPHAFRHFYACEFLKQNPNVALLADTLGHADINTTRIYLRQTEEQQRAEIARTVNW